MSRHIIVADVETNGLDPKQHQAVEVAWWNLTLDQRGTFIPRHDVSHVLSKATIEALRLNRYIDRLADAKQDDGKAAAELSGHLRDQTLAGSNPAFDAVFITKAMRDMGLRSSTWHHRLFDLSAYAAGVLGLSPDEGLPGLAAVADRLGIMPVDPHTAAGDVDTTGRCFLELFRRAGVSL